MVVALVVPSSPPPHLAPVFNLVGVGEGVRSRAEEAVGESWRVPLLLPLLLLHFWDGPPRLSFLTTLPC